MRHGCHGASTVRVAVGALGLLVTRNRQSQRLGRHRDAACTKLSSRAIAPAEDSAGLRRSAQKAVTNLDAFDAGQSRDRLGSSGRLLFVGHRERTQGLAPAPQRAAARPGARIMIANRNVYDIRRNTVHRDRRLATDHRCRKEPDSHALKQSVFAQKTELIVRGKQIDSVSA